MNLSFLSSDWLLESKAARDLYFGYAQDAPVVDFHNHLSVEDILSDRRFGDICSLWVAEDRYKHRAMRIAGMDESLITGDSPAHDKFVAWCSLLPRLMGNPLFHWSCLGYLELRNCPAQRMPKNFGRIATLCSALKSFRTIPF